MPDAEQRFADSLNQALDNLVDGARSRDRAAPALDPDLARTIAQFHARDTAPAADGAFADRLLARLLATTPPVHVEPHRAPGKPNGLDHGLGRPRPYPGAPPAPARFPWAVAQLATAALIVLTVVSGVVISGNVRRDSAPGGRAVLTTVSARSGLPAPEADQARVIPVASVPGAVGYTTETLFAETIGEPPEGAKSVFLEQWTFKPGVASLTIAPDEGPQWIIVGDGSLAVVFDGAESSLSPGQALLVPEGQELVIRNTGQSTATLLHGSVTQTSPRLQYDSRLITYLLPINSTHSLARGPLRVVVERLALAPGATMPAFTLAENQWLGLGAGRVGVTLEGNRLPLYWGAGDERAFSYPSLFPTIAAGTRLTLRNVGEDELLLYRLTITPDAAASSSEESPGADSARG